MFSSKLLFLSALPSTKAFLPTPTKASIMSATSLRSITFEPLPDDNCELDGSDCEESVFERKRKEKMNANQSTKERYAAMGVQLSDADLIDSNIDQYANAPLGGSLMAGISLSALCEDD